MKSLPTHRLALKCPICCCAMLLRPANYFTCPKCWSIFLPSGAERAKMKGASLQVPKLTPRIRIKLRVAVQKAFQSKRGPAK